MDTVHKHLKHPNTTARLMFDYFSAFNTLQPHIHPLPPARPVDPAVYRPPDQKVTDKVNNTFSSVLVTSSGFTQSCLLSPLLFILYANDYRCTHPDCHLVKDADDTVLLPLLSGPSYHHSSALHEFVEWCDKLALELNTEKTKEMVVTFSSKQRELAAPECRDCRRAHIPRHNS